MSDSRMREQTQIEPVQAGEAAATDGRWTERLVTFLRVMAGVSMLKGLYHWSVVCGIGEGPETGFAAPDAVAFQTATVFFAVIDLVAAVGLWLAAAWGAVVWLTSVISMIAVELLFTQVFGGRILILLIEFCLLGTYLWLASQAARERPP
jgi:hypothetical protein